jgi:hypothetical protein
MQATDTRPLADPRAGLAAVAAAVIFAAGIVLGAMIHPDPATVGSQISAPLGDRRYDAVEETRLDRGLSVPLGDRRYDAVEETRLDRDTD